MQDSTIDIRHDAARRRFEATVDAQVSHLDYVQEGEALRMHHTEVPAALEGRGIASRLVQFAFDHARSEHLKVAPACS